MNFYILIFLPLVLKSGLTRQLSGQCLLTATAKLLILFLVMGIAAAPARVAIQAQGAGYSIKLVDPKKYSLLLGIGTEITRRFSGTNIAQFQNVYTFKSAYGEDYLKNYLAGAYEYLEAYRSLSASAVTVNDPGFNTDYRNIDKQWGLIKTYFNEAWEKTTGSYNNIVAVLDTGIDATHEDLKGLVYKPGYDFINRRPIAPGGNSDDNGHGTLVAGILGAVANNGLGVAGTNWKISLMPIKALDHQGKGTSVDLAESLVWAADHGAQFINLSVGGIGFGHDTSLANAVAYAFNKNTLIVAASGNDVAVTGGNLDSEPVFPICEDNNFNMIIGVSAVDYNDIKPEFSNYGKNCIDVVAPGKRILSTINYDPLSQQIAPNSYAYASGSSMAVPFVVGEAALIKSLYPQATNIQIRDRIISTAESVDNLNLFQCGKGSCRSLLGAGRINAAKSLEAVISPDFVEGDLVKVTDFNNAVYRISGGQRRLVSSFVYNQRFSGAALKTAVLSQLRVFPEGAYTTPVEGTLVKYHLDPTVYIMENGQKLPLTYEVFSQRELNFANVKAVSFPELDSWVIGSFYPPLEGGLIKGRKDPTVYWVLGKVLHPVNNKFFIDRGLKIFSILIVPDADLSGYAKGEAYIR